MQEPEFGSSTYHTDLTVGDYIAFYASTDVVDGITITYSVETMNDDGTVTFYDDFRERFVTCTVEEFFAGGITGDYVVRGTSLSIRAMAPGSARYAATIRMQDTSTPMSESMTGSATRSSCPIPTGTTPAARPWLF